jgi:small conductance mechanosensitive channel
VGGWLLARMVRWALRQWAEKSQPHLRLRILRVIPLARLLVGVATVVWVVRIIIEPSFQNVLALTASVGLVLAFVLKDYASSLIAGLVTMIENPYQPGDWVEMDGVYGEVKLINLRAVHLVTAAGNEVIIPHYQLWAKKISNATSGSRSLLCIADFYLHPDHDGQTVIDCLEKAGEASPLRMPGSKVSVLAQEKPWATHYKLKAYVQESREQFKFITDLTVRGKQALRAQGIQFASALPVVNVGKK